MVRHQGLESLEPELGELAQQLAFIRDRVRQHAIKSREAVTRNEHQLVAEIVDIAHLPAGDKLNIGHLGLENSGRGFLRHRRLHGDLIECKNLA